MLVVDPEVTVTVLEAWILLQLEADSRKGAIKGLKPSQDRASPWWNPHMVMNYSDVMKTVSSY